MGRPKAYDPQQGYMFQLFYMSPYDKEYEHLDYAVDKAGKKQLMEDYRLSFHNQGKFKSERLPRKYWKG